MPGRTPQLLAIVTLLSSTPAAGVQVPVQSAITGQGPGEGKALFESQCARCHGLEGGGGMGPSLRRPKLRRAADDSALTQVIKDGVTGTAMPGAWQLSDRELSQVVGYVRSLGRLPDEPLPGDSGRGRRLFEGRGGCLACHTVTGEGGVLGPELTEIGAMRNLVYLREALLDPGATQPVRPLFTYRTGDYARYLVVRVVTRDGLAVLGQRINEDPFTIQLRDGNGRLYSFEKQELRRLERRPAASLMPGFGQQFSPAELDDVVSYLASLRGAP